MKLRPWVEDPYWRMLVIAQAERTVAAYDRGPLVHAAAVDGLARLLIDAEAWVPPHQILPCAKGVH